MRIKRDSLHFTFRTIDGYNKPFNFVISEREAGKSTAVWLDKAYKAFKENGSTSLVIRRQVVDITDVYIRDIEEIINKFTDDNIKLSYKNSAIKDGIVQVNIDDKPFVRIVGLSISMSRIKSLMLRNLKYIIFDEFICNTRMGERYLKEEAFKFKELFNTFQRENPAVKCYFLGNPYSLYNPYFSDFGVDTRKIERGKILAGENFVVQCYEICDELRKLILKRNPLYKFDDSYTKYAFGGLNINDSNIKLGTKRDNYYLHLVIRIHNKLVGIWKNKNRDDLETYFVNFMQSTTRDAYCFDFSDLQEKTILLTNEFKFYFEMFKRAISFRDVYFETIEAYYLIEEVYESL